MQFRSGADLSELRILDDGREVGRIEMGTVRFTGFTTPHSAAVAAQVAIRALSRRRSRSSAADASPDELVLASHRDGQYLIGRSSLLARLVPPEPPGSVWGFEVPLRFDEQAPVFAMSRARTMWQAIRGAGLAASTSELSQRSPAGALAAGGV
jgi:hypothetical protein